MGNVSRGVACVSTTNCYAVGIWIGQVPFTLVEHWNGTAWSIVSSPNPSLTGDNELNGVSCAARPCLFRGRAVGGREPLVVEDADRTVERHRVVDRDESESGRVQLVPRIVGGVVREHDELLRRRRDRRPEPDPHADRTMERFCVDGAGEPEPGRRWRTVS